LERRSANQENPFNNPLPEFGISRAEALESHLYSDNWLNHIDRMAAAHTYLS
jgi:hypothetical protein